MLKNLMKKKILSVIYFKMSRKLMKAKEIVIDKKNWWSRFHDNSS